MSGKRCFASVVFPDPGSPTIMITSGIWQQSFFVQVFIQVFEVDVANGILAGVAVVFVSIIAVRLELRRQTTILEVRNVRTEVFENGYEVSPFRLRVTSDISIVARFAFIPTGPTADAAYVPRMNQGQTFLIVIAIVKLAVQDDAVARIVGLVVSVALLLFRSNRDLWDFVSKGSERF
jgi:hypothetical protein